MDKLIGAEIVNIWEEPRPGGMFYALAVINRQRTIAIYSEIIRINQINIEYLINMDEEEKNTVNGIARYKLAAQIAKRNEKYTEVISAAGGSTEPLKLHSAGFTGLSLDDEAQKIIKNTTVAIEISIYVDGEIYDDYGNRNRLRDAAAKIIEREQLQTVQGNNSLYNLEIIVYMDTSFSNALFYSNYNVSSKLIENSTGRTRYTFNGMSAREWRSTKKEAIDAAFTLIERRINEQYSLELKNFFGKLIPEI